MWDEISLYDMKSFAQIIICVGGNDCSIGMDTHVFEDSYEKLISLIKIANKDCIIYLSKVVPRRDVDVSAFNSSITRTVDDWAMHLVKCTEGSYDLFFERNRSSRYFSEDGIHLSNAGTKRLLDAWRRHVNIVHDFNLCVFQASTFKKTFRPGANTPNNYMYKR